MNLAFEAMQFARDAHASQRRKYTDAPYADHLAEVAGIVATVAGQAYEAVSIDEMLAVAWLHDCVEDQNVNTIYLECQFGRVVKEGVAWLSDLEKGNRATRKRLSRERLSQAPGWVQTIKCADLISNTGSIVQFDPQFAKVYLEEKRLLLEVMTKADPRLWMIASDLSKVTKLDG